MFARILPAGICVRPFHVGVYQIHLSSSCIFLGHRVEFVAELNVQVFSVKGSVFWTPANLRHMDTSPGPVGAAELQVWTVALACLLAEMALVLVAICLEVTWARRHTGPLLSSGRG